MLEDICFIVTAPTVEGGFRNSTPGFQTVWSPFLRAYTVVASLGDAKIEMTFQWLWGKEKSTGHTYT